MRYFLTVIFVVIMFRQLHSQGITNSNADSSNNLGNEKIYSSRFSLDTATKKRNLLYLELFGQGYSYSLNYEREHKTPLRKSFSQSFRVGISTPFIYNSSRGKTKLPFLIPLSYYFIFGKKSSKLELGAGIDITFNFNPYPQKLSDRIKILQDPRRFLDTTAGRNQFVPIFRIFPAPSISYRLSTKKGFIFKTTFLPIIEYYWVTTNRKYFEVHPYGGISIGHSF
jgi:hypothetical protein